MAQTSGFFEAIYNEEMQTYDLEYLASQFAEYFSNFVGNGVFGSPTNQLKVYENGGKSVRVSSGFGFINGYWYKNSTDLVISIPDNTSSSVRNDSICLRYDNENRQISVIHVMNDTNVRRSENVYDLQLAIIQVMPNANITNSNIKDTRTDESVCGLVKGLIEVETTRDLFAQYESIFNDWFNKTKDQLQGDLAIKLQTEFDELNNNVNNFERDMNKSFNTLDDKTSDNSSNAKNSANYSAEGLKAWMEDDFIIPEITCVFSNGQCVIEDTRIDSNTLVEAFFPAGYMPEAESAVITVESNEGSIVLRAQKSNFTVGCAFRCKKNGIYILNYPQTVNYIRKGYGFVTLYATAAGSEITYEWQKQSGSSWTTVRAVSKQGKSYDARSSGTYRVKFKDKFDNEKIGNKFFVTDQN